MMKEEEDDTIWITVNGKHIPIEDDETKANKVIDGPIHPVLKRPDSENEYVKKYDEIENKYRELLQKKAKLVGAGIADDVKRSMQNGKSEKSTRSLIIASRMSNSDFKTVDDSIKRSEFGNGFDYKKATPDMRMKYEDYNEVIDDIRGKTQKEWTQKWNILADNDK